MGNIDIKLKENTVDNLYAFSDILKKDFNTIFEEALEEYFENKQQEFTDKNREDEGAMTNLDFDEFWDGVEID